MYIIIIGIIVNIGVVDYALKYKYLPIPSICLLYYIANIKNSMPFND